MTNKVMRQNLHRKQNHSLVVTALDLAQAESAAARQVNALVDALWREEKYGSAPREKPAHSIRIVIENFNSLQVTSGNSKINAINTCSKVSR